jgi:periplasmic mercuric ion binding protein
MSTLVLGIQLKINQKNKKMKNVLFVVFAVLFVQVATAQEKKAKFETVVIQTSAECGDCEERIENLLNYTKGVKFSELDVESKKLTVKFQPAKISLEAIKKKLAELGYDADEMKANPEAQQKLPSCCQPGGMKH